MRTSLARPGAKRASGACPADGLGPCDPGAGGPGRCRPPGARDEQMQHCIRAAGQPAAPNAGAGQPGPLAGDAILQCACGWVVRGRGSAWERRRSRLATHSSSLPALWLAPTGLTRRAGMKVSAVAATPSSARSPAATGSVRFAQRSARRAAHHCRPRPASLASAPRMHGGGASSTATAAAAASGGARPAASRSCIQRSLPLCSVAAEHVKAYAYPTPVNPCHANPRSRPR